MLFLSSLYGPDGPLAIGTYPAVARGAFFMASSAEDCWKLAGECIRWAEEAEENSIRRAFRQMADVWSQLAFEQYTPQNHDAARGCP